MLRDERTIGVQKDCVSAEAAAGELGADLRCLPARHDLGRMRRGVGVDDDCTSPAAAAAAAGELDLCIADTPPHHAATQS